MEDLKEERVVRKLHGSLARQTLEKGCDQRATHVQLRMGQTPVKRGTSDVYSTRWVIQTAAHHHRILKDGMEPKCKGV